MRVGEMLIPKEVHTQQIQSIPYHTGEPKTRTSLAQEIRATLPTVASVEFVEQVPSEGSNIGMSSVGAV